MFGLQKVVFTIKVCSFQIRKDLENAKDGFEHTECEYFNKENLPQQENNEELMDLLKKILK